MGFHIILPLILQPHEVNSSQVKQVSKKRRIPDEISIQPLKKPVMPIIQLMPPPQKVR